MPLEIPSAAAPAPRSGSARRPAASRRARFGAKERMFFTERLALLLDTGVPLHASLETLSRQAQDAETRRIFGSVADDVASGLSFARALGRHPGAFPSTYVNLVDAAERGGFLPRVLERLRAMDERREELRSVLWAAFSYPVFLVFFSTAVVVFVLVVVFPKFADLFQEIRDALPPTTRLFMALSDLLRHQWPFVLGGLAAAGAGLLAWLRRPQGAEFAERVLLGTPGLRTVVVELQLVQFLSVMSLSLGNGVPMLDALRACREIVPGRRFRRFVERLETSVTEGRGVSPAFQSERFLPALVPQMIGTAEESGSLAAVMGRVADFYERELRKRLQTLAKIVEPALLVVMGAVVGLIVASLILPIFKLSRTVR